MARAFSANPQSAHPMPTVGAELSRTIGSHLGEVRDLVAKVSLFLDQHTGNPDLCQRTEIVLAELLNNIVEHAYREEGAGRITLRIVLCERAVRISTEDTGDPMPGGVLPEGLLPATDGSLSSLPEGGFGWFLLRNLAQDLSYERNADTNRIRLTLPYSGDSKPNT